MKFKKIFVSIIIAIIIFNINNNCFAKYVFEYVKIAIELDIDRSPPAVSVEYFKQSDKEVKVTIYSGEKIQEIDGWQLLDDGKTLVRIYNKNITEKIDIKDLSGNYTKVNIVVNSINET